MVETFCRTIDKINDVVGRLASFLFLPLIFVVMIEVTARYFFHKPTIWAWDVNIQLAAALAVLGGGYTLLYGGHVVVDVIVGRFSRRARAIIDLVTSLVFFFGIGVLLWLATGEAKISVRSGEHYTSLLQPPLGPLRTVVAIGVFLLLVQGLVKFIRDLLIATGVRKESPS